MLGILLNWVASALIFLLVDFLLPDIKIDNFMTALWVALVYSVLNALVRPVLSLLSLPLNLLSLGLFSFVVGAAVFGLTAWFVEGFRVEGFLPALIGSLLLGFFNFAANATVLRKPKEVV